MKTLCFLTFITGIMLSCCAGKEKYLEIQGKVIDVNTRETIPHRDIIVQSMIKNDGRFLPVYNGKFSTDSSGIFTYPLRKDKNAYLYNFCVVGDSDYAYTNIELGLTELNKHGSFLSFELKRLTDMIIKIDLKERKPADDVLYVSWKSDGIDGKLLHPYTIKDNGIASSRKELKWTGGNIKSEIQTRVFADKETIVRWETFSNGKSRVMSDTIICMRNISNSIQCNY